MDENTMNNNVIEEVAEIPAQEETIGNIKIAVDVIATIAGIATMEIQGVASMCTSFAGGIAEILGTKKSPTRGVKVEMTEAGTTIDVYIVVDYGVRIPELAWEVQENVKNSVESMTGQKVLKVNIHIDGISFAKEKEKEAEKQDAADQEAEEEIIVEETEIEEIPEDAETEV